MESIDPIKEAARIMGQRGGRARTPVKLEAQRRNAQRAGRPLIIPASQIPADWNLRGARCGCGAAISVSPESTLNIQAWIADHVAQVHDGRAAETTFRIWRRKRPVQSG